MIYAQLEMKDFQSEYDSFQDWQFEIKYNQVKKQVDDFSEVLDYLSSND